ncbi:MAG: TspO/MBR family protein [bacterium]
MNKIIKFIVSVATCLIAGMIGSVFTAPSIPAWYAGLQKPAFNPPNWIFAPVWTALFIMMGIAAYLVWDRGSENKNVKIALAAFGGQLFLNVLWSVLFFGLRSPSSAFVDIILLWLAILLTIICFYKVSRPASYLLIPYILWVSFAAVLNLSILLLNRY